MFRKLIGACVGLAMMGMAGTASAVPITVSTSDNQISPGVDNQGWWGTGVNTNPTNDNYISFEPTHRSYFSFDLGGITGTVISAVLEVRRYSTNEGATLQLFDVSTSATALAQRQILDSAIFNDLGSGTSYGSFVAAQSRIQIRTPG